jgi:hypothetical protein
MTSMYAGQLVVDGRRRRHLVSKRDHRAIASSAGQPVPIHGPPFCAARRSTRTGRRPGTGLAALQRDRRVQCKPFAAAAVGSVPEFPFRSRLLEASARTGRRCRRRSAGRSRGSGPDHAGADDDLPARPSHRSGRPARWLPGWTAAISPRVRSARRTTIGAPPRRDQAKPVSVETGQAPLAP